MDNGQILGTQVFCPSSWPAHGGEGMPGGLNSPLLVNSCVSVACYLTSQMTNGGHITYLLSL